MTAWNAEAASYKLAPGGGACAAGASCGHYTQVCAVEVGEEAGEGSQNLTLLCPTLLLTSPTSERVV